MRLTHSHHAHHVRAYHRIARSDFWLFELSVWFHALALSLVSIFVPILLYKTGFSISEIVLYYFIFNAVDVPLNFAAAALTRRIGARVVTVLGTLAAILFVISLLHLHATGANLSSLMLMAFFAALYDTLYWVAHLYLFIQSDTDGNNAGKNTGVFYAVRQTAVTIGPMIGAATLLLFNENILLLAVIFLFLVSLAPLAVMDHPDDKPAVKLPSVDFFKHLHIRRTYLSKLLYNFHSEVESTLFPLFIFTIFGTISSVAIIPVIASVAAIITALSLGNIPRERRQAAVIGGAAIIALAWLGRILFPNPLFFYASILLIGVFAHFVLVPLDSEIFEYARESGDPLSASLWRNVTDMAANAILYAILLLALHILPASIAVALISLLALILLNLFMRREKTAAPAVV